MDKDKKEFMDSILEGVGSEMALQITGILAGVLIGAAIFKLIHRLRRIPITEKDYPKLYTRVQKIAESAGIGHVDLYMVKNRSSNMYISLLGKPTIYMSMITAKTLNEDELTVGAAHEISHYKNRVRILSTSLIISALTMIVGTAFIYYMSGKIHDTFKSEDEKSGVKLGATIMCGLGLLILGSTLLRTHMGRKEEYDADAFAVQATKNPEALKSALTKIEDYNLPTNPLLKVAVKIIENISNMFGLFGTHPSNSNRFKAIDKLSKENFELVAHAAKVYWLANNSDNAISKLRESLINNNDELSQRSLIEMMVADTNA